jgi:hypothetical protein
MVKALEHSQVRGDRGLQKPIAWTKRMSDHIAAALLVYTALHIIVTMQAIKGEGGSILPYFGLVLLVGAIIPGCRLFEKRWERLASSGEPDERLRPLFVRDALYLWIAAIGLPFAVTGLIMALSSLS